MLAKVRYDRLDSVTGDRRLLVGSLLLNWVVGPALMFAWRGPSCPTCGLPHGPGHRRPGAVHRDGDHLERPRLWRPRGRSCPGRLQSVFQVVAFAGLGWFYLSVLPGWLGLSQTGIDASTWDIARSVLIFLGVPLLAGFLSRRLGERAKGRTGTRSASCPHRAVGALRAAVHDRHPLRAPGGGHHLQPLDVARIALPLLVYFAVMWGGGFAVGAGLGLGYERTTTLAFTAAGNNFELAIAVAIATFGAASGRRWPELSARSSRLPVLVALVYVSLALRRRFAHPGERDPSALTHGIRPLAYSSRKASSHDRQAQRPVRLRPQRRPLPDGGRLPCAPLRWRGGGPVGRLAPADQVQPAAVEAMAEEGIDIAAEVPKVLTTDAVRESDVVITMGCGDTCPIFPGKRYEDWELDDPAGKGVEAVRPIRDQIKARILTCSTSSTSRRPPVDSDCLRTSPRYGVRDRASPTAASRSGTAR